MSLDFYLLRLPDEAGIDAALSLLNDVEACPQGAKRTYDRHRLANLLIKLDPRYEPFEKDYEAMAKFERITVKEARSRDDSVELNGEADGKPMAQFVIYDNRVVVHWYSGTTETEMNRYLKALCEEAGYALVDSQASSVTRFSTNRPKK